MQKFNVGDIIIGRVSGVANFGIFVSVDEVISGLIHISEMSDGFVKDVSKFVSVGDYILVKVIDIKEEKLMLSIKDINYKTKKSCIELSEPKLYVNPDEFKILQSSLKEWLDEV